MMLIEEWRTVLKRAWSVRLMIIAALLSGVEIILPMFSDIVPRGLFAALSFAATVGASVARFVAQGIGNGTAK